MIRVRSALPLILLLSDLYLVYSELVFLLLILAVLMSSLSTFVALDDRRTLSNLVKAGFFEMFIEAKLAAPHFFQGHLSARIGTYTHSFNL